MGCTCRQLGVCQRSDEVTPSNIGECRGPADVMQYSVGVIQAEEQRGYDIGAIPSDFRTPATHDDVGRPAVLELPLGTDSWLVRIFQGLDDEPVHPSGFVFAEPAFSSDVVLG
jgi:hypothetical protein